MRDVEMGSDEKQDFISELPNEVLTFILSKLRVDEAVRCNILAKRWLGLWKKAPHIEFNGKHMIRPVTQLLHSRESTITQDPFLYPFMKGGVFRYGFVIFQLMFRHSSNLSSCRFLHFKKSLWIGEVDTWIKFLVNKMNGLKHLSLECLPDYGEDADEIMFENEIYKLCISHKKFHCLSSLDLINYTMDSWCAFEDCHNLKILKLEKIHLDDFVLSGILQNCVALENFSLIESTGFTKLIIVNSNLKILRLQALCVCRLEVIAQNLEVLFLDSITCPVKNLSIYAPSLSNFESHSYSISSIEERTFVMKSYDIIAYFIDLSMQQSCNILPKLSAMSLDLDLNNLEEIMYLSSALGLCTSLQVLDITLPEYDHNDFTLPFLKPTLFWEMRLCKTITQKLKFVTIRGFKGKEKEVEFAKFLITRATMMKRINIICYDSIEVAENLLSLPRASHNLTINLKCNFN
ncbi:putative F-box protein At1g67390 [Trifolium pratense]|uniref:putative F-box protein At1g67390 n=1 Tax=Trifolium pratense TaxID=57577 RepID=UPI001E6928C3|nr:putative F-box protein At1g67390 [Trifolium pratense]